MGNTTERMPNDDDLFADAMKKLQTLEEKAETDIRDARREVFWLLKTRQWEQASHYVEHVCQAEDVRDLTLTMQGYCTLMMQEIKHPNKRRVTPHKLKEVRAGFHFIATRCKELSCLQDIYQALTMKYGHQYPVDPHIARNLCPTIPRFSVERREEVLEDIAMERGLSLVDLGVGSPEIVESCKICSMTQSEQPNPNMPETLSSLEEHEDANLFMSMQ